MFSRILGRRIEGGGEEERRTQLRIRGRQRRIFPGFYLNKNKPCPVRKKIPTFFYFPIITYNIRLLSFVSNYLGSNIVGLAGILWG